MNWCLYLCTDYFKRKNKQPLVKEIEIDEHRG